MTSLIPGYQQRVRRQVAPDVKEQLNDVQGRQEANLHRAAGQTALAGAQAAQQIAGAIENVAGVVYGRMQNAAFDGAIAEAEEAKRTYLYGRKQNAAFDGAIAEAGEARDTYLYEGYMNMKGEVALQNRDEVLEMYRKRGEEIKGKLTGDARRQFERRWEMEYQQFALQVDRHLMKQSEVLAKENHDAAVRASQHEAVAAAVALAQAQTPEERQAATQDLFVALGKGEDTVRRRAFSLGMSDDEDALRMYRTDTHLQVLDRLLDSGAAQKAKEYFDVARSSMDEAVIAKTNIEARIGASLVQDRSIQLAETAWAIGADDEGNPDLLLSLKWIDTFISDPAERAATRKRLMDLNTNHKAAVKATYGPAVSTLQLAIEEDMNAPVEATELYESLDDEHKRKVLAYKNARLMKAQEHLRMIQDAYDRHMLTNFLTNSPEKRLEMDIDDTYRYVSPEGKDAMRAHTVQLAEATRKMAGVSKERFSDLIEGAFDLMGKEGLSKEKRPEYRAALEKAFAVQVIANEGKPPTPEQTAKIIGNVLLYGRVKDPSWVNEIGRFFGGDEEMSGYLTGLEATKWNRMIDPEQAAEHNKRMQEFLRALGRPIDPITRDRSSAPRPPRPLPKPREGYVWMYTPDGKYRMILETSVPKFLERGYKRVSQ